MGLVHVTGGIVLVSAPDLELMRAAIAESKAPPSPLSLSAGIAVSFPEGSLWTDIEQGVAEAVVLQLRKMQQALHARAAAMEGRPVPEDVPPAVREQLSGLMPNRRARRALENG